MIVKEFHSTRIDGKGLCKTYSDKGVYIQKVGTNEIYAMAVDVLGTPFEYVETDNVITEAEIMN